jgi:hypothetical protein
MEAMTDHELAAIEARANAATPGPWGWREVGSGFYPTAIVYDRDDAEVVKDTDFIVKDDLEFIAHAREDIPKLIAEIRRLKDDIRGLKTLFHPVDAKTED